MKIIWLKSATDTLSKIIKYIQKENRESASKLRNSILLEVESLSTFPYKGRARKVSGTIELVTCYPYIIIYAIRSNHISIIRVIHGAQEYPPKK